ncbi:hypothetical protein EBI_25877 [Enterocytozoon bieneusi H348]|nr:hypothetical protein EBI_25877 [Enterocytozoon bieneusi H348]|eukprot:XP_001827998.1 hypothetical protein EBI_25877 [Enterocytozoon bieneusi H348]
MIYNLGSSFMEYYNINNFLSDEQYVSIMFNEKIYPTKLYKGINPFKKIELPIFLIKFLLENEFCEICAKCDNKLIDNLLIFNIKNDLYAQPELVNFQNQYFYTFINASEQISFDTKLNSLNQNTFFINTIFLYRMGYFSKLLVKDNFHEKDLEYLSFEEYNIILNARYMYQRYQKYEINLIS